MKKTHVITIGQDTVKDAHQLPPDCNTITGVFVSALCKTNNAMQQREVLLSFPQDTITRISKSPALDLHYMMVKTRVTEAESRHEFATIVLPTIVQLIRDNVIYTIPNTDIGNDLAVKFENDFIDYLYTTKGLYGMGHDLNVKTFKDFILSQILVFAFEAKDSIFKFTESYYDNLPKKTAGAISLLLNGNNFLLRDFYVETNRDLGQIDDEMIPFNERLKRNNSLTIVYKHEMTEDVRIKVYVQYEKEVGDDE